jgi:hypothetical protein
VPGKALSNGVESASSPATSGTSIPGRLVRKVINKYNHLVGKRFSERRHLFRSLHWHLHARCDAIERVHSEVAEGQKDGAHEKREELAVSTQRGLASPANAPMKLDEQNTTLTKVIELASDM